jgi:hypothetical protein
MKTKDLLHDLTMRLGTPGAEPQKLPDDLLLQYLTTAYRKAHNICVRNGEYPELRYFYISVIADQELYDVPRDIDQIINVRRVDNTYDRPVVKRRGWEKDWKRSATENSDVEEWWPEYNLHKLGIHPKPSAAADDRYQVAYVPVAGRLVVLNPFALDVTEDFNAGTDKMRYFNSAYETFDSNVMSTTAQDTTVSLTDGQPVWYGYYVSSLCTLAVEETTDYWTYGHNGFLAKISGATVDNDVRIAMGEYGALSANRIYEKVEGWDNLTDNSVIFIHFHLSNAKDFVDSGTPFPGMRLRIYGATDDADYYFPYHRLVTGDNYIIIPLDKLSDTIDAAPQYIQMIFYYEGSDSVRIMASKFAFFENAVGIDIDEATNNVGPNRPVEELAAPLDLAYEAIITEALQKVKMMEGNIELATYYRTEAEREWEMFEKEVARTKDRQTTRMVRKHRKSVP